MTAAPPGGPAVGAMPTVKALLLLDADGKRVAVKYYVPEWWGVVEVEGGDEGGMPRARHRRRPPAHRPPPHPPPRSTVHAQAEFEKAVFAKTARVNARGEGEKSCGWGMWRD